MMKMKSLLPVTEDSFHYVLSDFNSSFIPVNKAEWSKESLWSHLDLGLNPGFVTLAII